jgi:hypothetical protein
VPHRDDFDSPALAPPHGSDPGSAREAEVTVLMDNAAHREVVVSSGEIPPSPMPMGPTPSPSGTRATPMCRTPWRTWTAATLSIEVMGGFLGRTNGMFAVGGDAAFDWFVYREV